jgi:endogenous inhibitor of DNA gyrase (YacG/DUF329 family)
VNAGTPPQDDHEPMSIACPSCGKVIRWSPDSPWRPFCSRRCRLLDLGAWIDGTHRIPGEGTARPAEDEDE